MRYERLWCRLLQSMSYSPWLNALGASTAAGEVLLCYLPNLLRNKSSKRQSNCRLVNHQMFTYKYRPVCVLLGCLQTTVSVDDTCVWVLRLSLVVVAGCQQKRGSGRKR